MKTLKFATLLCLSVVGLAACGNGGGSSTTSSQPTTSVPATVTHTVTFYNNYEGAEAAVYKTVTVEDGKLVTKPADPTRSGYSFVDWYTNAECQEGDEFDFDSRVTKDLAAYAAWEKLVFPQADIANYLGLFAEEVPEIEADNYEQQLYRNGMFITCSGVTAEEYVAVVEAAETWTVVEDTENPGEVWFATTSKQEAFKVKITSDKTGALLIGIQLADVIETEESPTVPPTYSFARAIRHGFYPLPAFNDTTIASTVAYDYYFVTGLMSDGSDGMYLSLTPSLEDGKTLANFWDGYIAQLKAAGFKCGDYQGAGHYEANYCCDPYYTAQMQMQVDDIEADSSLVMLVWGINTEYEASFEDFEGVAGILNSQVWGKTEELALVDVGAPFAFIEVAEDYGSVIFEPMNLPASNTAKGPIYDVINAYYAEGWQVLDTTTSSGCFTYAFLLSPECQFTLEVELITKAGFSYMWEVDMTLAPASEAFPSEGVAAWLEKACLQADDTVVPAFAGTAVSYYGADGGSYYAVSAFGVEATAAEEYQATLEGAGFTVTENSGTYKAVSESEYVIVTFGVEDTTLSIAVQVADTKTTWTSTTDEDMWAMIDARSEYETVKLTADIDLQAQSITLVQMNNPTYDTGYCKLTIVTGYAYTQANLQTLVVELAEYQALFSTAGYTLGGTATSWYAYEMTTNYVEIDVSVSVTKVGETQYLTVNIAFFGKDSLKQ